MHEMRIQVLFLSRKKVAEILRQKGFLEKESSMIHSGQPTARSAVRICFVRLYSFFLKVGEGRTDIRQL